MLCVATYNPVLQHILRVLQHASVFRCSDRHEPCGLAIVAEILQSSTRLCALRLCGNGIGGSDEGETHGTSLPQPRRDCTHRCHICAGTGLTAATSPPGSGHISAGTGLIRAKSAPVGLGSPQPHQPTALVQASRS